jgi:hypothetical protein
MAGFRSYQSYRIFEWRIKHRSRYIFGKEVEEHLV